MTDRAATINRLCAYIDDPENRRSAEYAIEAALGEEADRARAEGVIEGLEMAAEALDEGAIVATKHLMYEGAICLSGAASRLRKQALTAARREELAKGGE